MAEGVSMVSIMKPLMDSLTTVIIGGMETLYGGIVGAAFLITAQ